MLMTVPERRGLDGAHYGGLEAFMSPPLIFALYLLKYPGSRLIFFARSLILFGKEREGSVG